MTERIDVNQIMQEIKKEVQRKIKEVPEYAQDINKVNKIAFNFTIAEEDIEANLSYINHNYNIQNLDNVQSKKIFIGPVVNKLRERIKIEVGYLMNPIINKQTIFNSHITRLFNGLTRSLKNTEERISDLIYPNLNLNYKAFEDQFRGSSEEMKNRNQQFLRFFHECKEVLDIGCGRGDFIQQLHAYGTGAYGIDIDEDKVRECKKKNLNVLKTDALTHLQSLKDDSLDGIYCDQVLEHLSKKDIVEVIRLSHQKIKPGKQAIFTTINIKNLNTFANSVFRDISHITPLHPDTLKFLCQEAGYSEINFIFYSFVTYISCFT